MLRPKLTLHLGEHALTNICYRQPISTTRVHSAQGTRVQLWTSFPFNRDPISPSARPGSPGLSLSPLASIGDFETNLRTRRWTRWNYREGYVKWRTVLTASDNGANVLYDRRERQVKLQLHVNVRWSCNRTPSYAWPFPPFNYMPIFLCALRYNYCFVLRSARGWSKNDRFNRKKLFKETYFSFNGINHGVNWQIFVN